MKITITLVTLAVAIFSNSVAGIPTEDPEPEGMLALHGMDLSMGEFVNSTLASPDTGLIPRELLPRASCLVACLARCRYCSTQACAASCPIGCQICCKLQNNECTKCASEYQCEQ